MYLGLFIVSLAFITYVLYSVYHQRKHKAEMMRFKHRIHINGIRGKSSVTRLIAAAYREGGVKTVAKTTGSAARIVVSHDKDVVIKRKEADIAEQKRILDLFKHHKDEPYEAVVFECMAINPVYQKYLENKIMYSNIGVITNVREDHMDMLGYTLPDIARSLASTVPKNGHLITAETNEELLEVLREVCDERRTKLHAVGNMRIADKHMQKFKHYEYKTNVAIAIKAAQLAGIPRSTALAGMQQALADPGAFVLKKIAREDKTIHWANLFAINDRESFVMTTQALNEKVGATTPTAVILNNRQDRPERVAQFVDISVNNLGADYLFAFGDYEKQVKREVEKLQPSYNVQVIGMGNESDYADASGNELMDKITETIDKEVLLFGAVNIHTKQAQAILTVLEGNYAH